jgi:hypothetical protein
LKKTKLTEDFVKQDFVYCKKRQIKLKHNISTFLNDTTKKVETICIPIYVYLIKLLYFYGILLVPTIPLELDFLKLI